MSNEHVRLEKLAGAAETIADRDAVAALVRSVRRAHDRPDDIARIDARLLTVNAPGSALRLLGSWHVAALRAEFGTTTRHNRAFLDRVLDVADTLAHLGHPVTDQSVRRVMTDWVDPDAAARRSAHPASDAEVWTLAVSVDESLAARGITDSLAGLELDDAVRTTVAEVGDGADAQTPWQHGVAMRVMRLSLTPSGLLRLTDLHESLVRAAVFIDISSAGRLERADPADLIDTEPTGFAAADHLLATIQADPHRTLHHWLSRGPKLTGTLAGELTATGYWQPSPPHAQRPRFVVTDKDVDARHRREYQLCEFIAAGAATGAIDELTAAGLALLGRLLPTQQDWPSDTFVDACGRNAWILRVARLVVAEAYVREERAKALAGSISW